MSATQLTAHYANEYGDLETDRAVSNRTIFSGGSGVLVRGDLRPIVALTAAKVTSSVAVTAMVLLGRPILIGIGIVALSVSWVYSVPPLRLVASGWGELATTLVVVVLVPLTGTLVQGATPGTELLWAVAVLIPIHLGMLVAFEIPDMSSDSAAGKRVMAVRLGRVRSERSITGFYLMAAALAWSTDPAATTFPWIAIAALPAVGVIWAARSSRFGILTTAAVTTLVVATTALLVGLAG